MAATFGDGSCRVITVPIPTGSLTALQWQTSLLDAISHDFLYTKIVWSTSNLLGMGSSNGGISVWNMEPILSGKENPSDAFNEMPMLNVLIHHSTVMCIDFWEKDNQIFLLTGSTDGATFCTNIKDPLRPLQFCNSNGRLLSLCLSLGFITAIAGSHRTNSFVYADEHRIRGFRQDDGLGSIFSSHSSSIWASL